MKIMRESNELFQRKIDNIYTNNILIAKEGLQGTNKVEESKEDDRDKNKFMKTVQEEVRRLHFQL